MSTKKRLLSETHEITLPMIYDQFYEEGKGLIWSILDLDTVGNFNENDYLGKIVHEIWESQGKKTFLLTLDELYKMAENFEVVIDFFLIGCKDEETVFKIKKICEVSENKYPSIEEIAACCEILIDIDDGRLWGLYAKDQRIVDRCIENLGQFPLYVYLPPSLSNK